MQFYEIEFGTPEYDEAVKLRYRVLREPIGLDFTPELLAAEYDQFHLGAYGTNMMLCAYVLLSPIQKTVIKMQQVVVEPMLQKTGIGKKLIAFSEKWCSQHGFQEITLNARNSAIEFYEKSGYKKSGKAFEEIGIMHWTMMKKLS